ncbi:hypothetical protein MHYP_G00062380 [Metynnis hypsauchen]
MQHSVLALERHVGTKRSVQCGELIHLTIRIIPISLGEELLLKEALLVEPALEGRCRAAGEEQPAVITARLEALKMRGDGAAICSPHEGKKEQKNNFIFKRI